MNFSKDEYRLDFFVDEGFQRKKCEKCGKFFWSRDEISKLDYSDWRMSLISDIISSEEKKYDRIIKSGPRHISRLHSKYPNFIPYSEIINLYEVHGIPIDISKSIANSMGIEIRNI